MNKIALEREVLQEDVHMYIYSYSSTGTKETAVIRVNFSFERENLNCSTCTLPAIPSLSALSERVKS